MEYTRQTKQTKQRIRKQSTCILLHNMLYSTTRMYVVSRNNH